MAVVVPPWACGPRGPHDGQGGAHPIRPPLGTSLPHYPQLYNNPQLVWLGEDTNNHLQNLTILAVAQVLDEDWQQAVTQCVLFKGASMISEGTSIRAYIPWSKGILSLGLSSKVGILLHLAERKSMGNVSCCILLWMPTVICFYPIQGLVSANLASRWGKALMIVLR